MSAKDIQARIEASWHVWESFGPCHFTGKRFSFYCFLGLPNEAWHDFKMALDSVVRNKRK